MKSTDVDRAKLLFERGLEFLKKARESKDEYMRIVLLVCAVEAFAGSIVSLAAKRKRRKELCRLTTRRLINIALNEARRSLIISHEELLELKKGLHALRCIRNLMLHPWTWCLEKCPSIEPDNLVKVVERLAEIARIKLSRVVGSESIA